MNKKKYVKICISSIKLLGGLIKLILKSCNFISNRRYRIVATAIIKIIVPFSAEISHKTIFSVIQKGFWTFELNKIKGSCRLGLFHSDLQIS